jgi:site-specific recombinase XerD
MSTINFYLEKENRKGERPILLHYFFNNEKLKFSTRLKTKDKDWNVKNQKVKKNGENEAVINFKLDEFKRVIQKAELDTTLDPSKLTKEFVKIRLEESIGIKVQSGTLVEAFEEYIKSSSLSKTEGSIKTYKTTMVRLKEFERKTKKALEFENINLEFERKFCDFLIKDCELANNTVGRYIKTIKSFMKFAIDRGYTDNFKYKAFKIIRQEADNIYLTEEELMRIYNLKDLPKRLELVKDAFCLGCFTGMRFSDLSQLKEANIKNDFIELKSQKTRDSLKIPINSFTREILAKYNGEGPKMLTNQKMNSYLKEIGEIAELEESIVATRYSGVKRLENTQPKSAFLCTHTARRTFITLSLEKGMRPEMVMSITGHKDYSSFKKYIKLAENVKLKEMNNIWG